MMKRHKAETDEIMDIMFTMENEFEERQNDARQEFQSLRDEIKNKVLFKYFLLGFIHFIKYVRSKCLKFDPLSFVRTCKLLGNPRSCVRTSTI